MTGITAAGLIALSLITSGCGGTLEDDYRRGQRAPSSSTTTTTIPGT